MLDKTQPAGCIVQYSKLKLCLSSPLLSISRVDSVLKRGYGEARQMYDQWKQKSEVLQIMPNKNSSSFSEMFWCCRGTRSSRPLPICYLLFLTLACRPYLRNWTCLQEERKEGGGKSAPVTDPKTRLPRRREMLCEVMELLCSRSYCNQSLPLG